MYHEMFDEANSRLEKVTELIEQYGGIDGGDHKQWVIDQVMRIIKGDDYENWVKDMKGEWDEEYGDYEYDWDEGIAP